MSEARREQRKVIIGIDANAVLGVQSAHDSPHIIGRWGVSDRSSRGVTFAAWLHTTAVFAANTMFQKRPKVQWAHQAWATALRRQIDYILLDGHITSSLRDAGIVDALSFKSDHRCLFARFEFTAIDRRQRR